jgi:hypothetical protein
MAIGIGFHDDDMFDETKKVKVKTYEDGFLMGVIFGIVFSVVIFIIFFT